MKNYMLLLPVIAALALTTQANADEKPVAANSAEMHQDAKDMKDMHKSCMQSSKDADEKAKGMHDMHENCMEGMKKDMDSMKKDMAEMKQDMAKRDKAGANTIKPVLKHNHNHNATPVVK